MVATEKLNRLNRRRSSRGSGARSERRTNPTINPIESTRLTSTLGDENPLPLPTWERP